MQDAAKPDFAALPVAEEDFVELRNLGKIYVDKTDLIYKLAANTFPIFMARPRRFGKSLLCSTLADLFANGTENFKGLAIEHLWHEPHYPVLYLNFDSCNTSADDTNASINKVMYNLFYSSFREPFVKQCLQEANVDFAECVQLSSGDAMQLLFLVLTQYHYNKRNKFVIIIDEYDRLISKAIGNQNLFKQRIDWFSEFFSSIKGLRGKGCLRFVFITGITRYQHTGIGSGLNNVQDVSFDEEYSTLFGYTEDDLKRYFGAYIEYGAKRLGMSFDDYLNCLRYEYDGYCFEDTEDDDDYDDGDVVAVDAVDAVDAANAEESTEVTKVYNPWSILKSLQALSAKKVTLAKVMNRFWVDTGSESSFFVNFVRSLLLGLNKEKQQQWFLSFICTDLTADFSLHKSLLSAARSPYTADFSTPTDLVTAFRVAMVQAGYYTLKQLSSQEKAQLKSANEFYCIDGSIPFFLTVPNNEIETYLHYWFWPNLSTFLANELHDMLVIDILPQLTQGDSEEVPTA